MAAPTPQPTRQTISLTNPMGIPNLPLPPRRPGPLRPPRPPAPPQPMTPFPSSSEALRNIRQQEINDAYQQTLRIYQQASRNWTPNQPTSTINTRSSELFPPLPPPAISRTIPLIPPRVNAARTRGNTSTNRPSNIPNIRRRQPNTRNRSSRRKKNRKTRRAH